MLQLDTGADVEKQAHIAKEIKAIYAADERLRSVGMSAFG